MAKNKSLVEEAIIQMKNLEETVAENAKGILASTMKEEISELVKESLSEQEDEDEVETDVDITMDSDEDSEDESEEGSEEDSEDEVEMDTDNMDMSSDDVIDLSDESDDEVLRVFELMGPDDNIIVKKDDAGNINLKTDENEYMIVGEGDEEYEEMEEEEMYEMDMDYTMEEESDEESVEDIMAKVFGEETNDEMNEEEEEDEEENEGVVYEIEFDEEEMEEEEMEEEMYESDEEMEEEDMEYSMNESKMKIKAKGVGMGSPKFKYNQKPNMAGGFKTKMKKGNATMGTGKAKFEYKEGENMKMKMKPVKKKMETKEASRTLGSGSMFRKGGLPKPRAHSKFNTAIKENENSKELELLREKNEEYRKALNVFRNKLNEVAVFNSNLAYATRLFTEHSTSKQEKINILRRFDGVESLKESKNLYKTIKDELSPSSTQTMNESVERVIEKTPSTGSVNLIESKTYENPQFLRMKDLMTKIK